MFPKGHPMRSVMGWLPENGGVTSDQKLEIVHALKEAVLHWGEDITMMEFLKESGVTQHAIYKFWNSWSELRVEAGYKPRRVANVVYSDEELLDEAVRVIDDCGGFPTIREFNEQSRFPYHALYMRFGCRAHILEACENHRNPRSDA